ncbi:MAG: EAL domain-containing protein [Hydrogenophaga sp.]|nr:EAL domain-containing protein [Hydrogenophaga sp.]
MPLASAMLDGRGRVTAANASFRALFAHARSLHGMTVSALLAPDDRAAFQAMLAVALTTAGEPRKLEFSVPRPDGTRLWVIACAAPVSFRTAGGGPALLLQLTDITDLKDREADLVERESRWNNALVGSASGVWDLRLDTGAMYYSDVWRAIRGLAPDEPPPDAEEWLDLLHPDDRERVLHAIERQNAGDPAYMTFDYRERHKLGHWMWIECRGACVEWNAAGQPVRIIGTDTDITGRKASEEALNRMSRRLKLALDVSRIGVFEADFATGTADWDAGMRTIFGLDGDSDVRIGGEWEEMLHPEDAERVMKKVEHHVENLLPFSDEYRVVLADGSTRYIRSRTLPFIDSDGHRKMVGANWDVTADLALHNELERAKTLAEARNRDLEKAKERIEHIALHDHLTDLPNRRYLDELLEQLSGDDRQNGGGLAILHIDLDRFKQINDTLGHSAGDAMLRHAARILRENVREGDFVARIGGDEFVFVARFDGKRHQLSALADRLINELRKPVAYEGQDCRFGASIGIACDAKGRTDPRQLLLNADIALYHAKNSGRGRYAYFSLDRSDRMKDSRRLADEILRGLERDEFLPYYQFQFDANTLDVVGAETLARWRHPERGILTPGTFLTAAEEIGAVADIDGLILEKALADLKRWTAQGVNVPKISVNVSSRRLHDPALKHKLNALTFEAGTVSFELLESIFLDENDEQAMENLRHLRKLGIELEIDDFGTGHASIVSLLRLSPKTLKIDRELVQKVADSRARRNLVGSIIDIGRSLGIRVVAEGVETAGHVRVLRSLGCDVLQGYGLAVPMLFEETIGFLDRQEWRRTKITS